MSAAPIGFSFQCETLFKALVEHFRLQVVDEKEAVRFPRRLLVQLVQLLLRQQGAELLHQLVLVAQPPAAEELHVHPHGCADEPQLLRAHAGADLRMTAPDEESVQGAVGFMELRHIRKVVQDDLALLLDDAAQRRLVPVLPVGLLSFGIHPQVLLYVLLDGNPAVIDGNGRTEDVDSLKHAPVLLQNQADQSHGFAGFAGAEEDAGAWYQGHHGVRGLFAAVFRHRKEPIPLFHLPNSKPGSRAASLSAHCYTAGR